MRSSVASLAWVWLGCLSWAGRRGVTGDGHECHGPLLTMDLCCVIIVGVSALCFALCMLHPVHKGYSSQPSMLVLGTLVGEIARDKCLPVGEIARDKCLPRSGTRHTTGLACIPYQILSARQNDHLDHKVYDSTGMRRPVTVEGAPSP